MTEIPNFILPQLNLPALPYYNLPGPNDPEVNKMVSVYTNSKGHLAPPQGYEFDAFMHTIYRRLMHSKNTFSASLGRPREGKSWSQLTIGCMVDARHDFDASHIAFYPQDYLKKISTFHRGCYVVFDEPGAEWSARRFMSIANQMMSATHITFGSRLINVGWAVPNLKMQDINASRLLNFSFYLPGEPFPVGVARMYGHESNVYKALSYRTFLAYAWFAKPFQDNPDELKKYEEMKADYQDKSYSEYYDRFGEGGHKPSEKLTLHDITELAHKIAENPTKYMLKGKINPLIVQSTHGVLATDARIVKALAEKFIQEKEESEAANDARGKRHKRRPADDEVSLSVVTSSDDLGGSNEGESEGEGGTTHDDAVEGLDQGDEETSS